MAQRLHAKIGTIRQLEIALAVYEHGSIKAASEHLYLTQPTVSMQLKKLSGNVGFPLYDQIGKKLVFTDAGKALVKTAKAVMQNFADLESEIAELHGLKAGVLKLAVVTTSKYFIPHLIGPFCQLYPDVDVQLVVGNRHEIIQRLYQAEDDFCVFSHLPDDENVIAEEFLANPLVAIAADDHPISKNPNCSLATFAKETFIEREVGSGTRHAIEKFFNNVEIKTNTRMTIASNEAIKHAVMAGLGVSILSEYTLALGGRDGLKQLKIPELPIQTHWYFARLKQKAPSLLAATFMDYLIKEGRPELLNRLRDDAIINDIEP